MKYVIKKVMLFIHKIFSKKSRTSREYFLKKIKAEDRILEIGPFTNPSLRGKNISYFDVLNREDLIKRAKVENYVIADANNIPEIHFVSPEGNLSIIKEKFDMAYSSHCIEHQPNLIKHLIDVSNILESEGKYYLVIPDKRYCFDALLPETNIASIIEPFNERRKRHTLTNVIQHFALTTHNSTYRHWLGNHGSVKDVPNRTNQALKVYNDANGNYIDVHAWRFTPDSFVKTIDLLYIMNYTDLVVSEIFHTAIFSNEFYVILQKTHKFIRS